MTSIRNFFFLPLLFALTLCPVSTAAKKDDSAIQTITTIDELKNLLDSSGERLLVFDLYADWCMPCRILSPMLEKIAAAEKRASFYKIDTDKSPDIARAFGVTGIPLVVFVKNKQGVYSLTGVQRKETYLRVIDLFAGNGGSSGGDKPDGKIVGGTRVIHFSAVADPGKIYVYRGETVRLIIDVIDAPYSVHIPEYNISQEGKTGTSLELTFKAKKTGVFPIYCNGSCPRGDGSRFGRIVVIPYKSHGFKEMDAKTAAGHITKGGLLVLDVRTPNEFYAGHIKDALLIPLDQLADRAGEIAAWKKKPVLVYCRSGNRSTVASQILNAAGFKDIYHLSSGIRGWIAAGFDVVEEKK